jgi:hypothetical protein
MLSWMLLKVVATAACFMMEPEQAECEAPVYYYVCSQIIRAQD